MHFDTARAVVNLQGQPLATGQDEAGNPISATLGSVAVEALLAPKTEEGRQVALPGAEAVRLFTLAQRIFTGGTIEITPEEAATIRAKVAEAYAAPLIVGQVWAALEG